MFVCLFVFFLSATRHLSTLRRCLRVSESRISRRGRPRASGQAHAQREHARACRTTSQRKNRCADAFQKQNRTHALVGADLGQLVYTYKRVVCVCLSVCLLFIGHTTFVHFAALAPSGREQPSRRGPGGPARAGKRMHSESTRACRTTSQRKNRTLMPFKNKTVRAHACCRITVCLLLECLLFESYFIFGRSQLVYIYTS